MQTIAGIKKIGSYKGVDVLFNWDDIGSNFEKKNNSDTLKQSIRRSTLLISSILLLIIFLLEFSAGRIPTFKLFPISNTGIVILFLFLIILVSGYLSFPKRKKIEGKKKKVDIYLNTFLSIDSFSVLNSVYKTQTSYIDEVFIEAVCVKDPRFTRIITSELGVNKLSDTIGIVEYHNKQEWIEYLLMNSLHLAVKTDIHQITPKILFLAYLDNKNTANK